MTKYELVSIISVDIFLADIDAFHKDMEQLAALDEKEYDRLLKAWEVENGPIKM